jgi:peptidoglycan/LPS O-acetylase OafA/YrhL
VVLGTLISIMDSGASGGFEAMFGLLIALWFFYMAFESYHTAAKRQRGEPVDEFSSLIPMRSPHASSAAAPLALIVLGVLFLIMNIKPEWTRELFKFWPALLIAAGVYMLVARWKASQEVPHERQ